MHWISKHLCGRNFPKCVDTLRLIQLLQMQVQNRVWIWEVPTSLHQDIIEVYKVNIQGLGAVQWMVLYSGTRLTGEELWVPKLNSHVMLEVTLVNTFYFSNRGHKPIIYFFGFNNSFCFVLGHLLSYVLSI